MFLSYESGFTVYHQELGWGGPGPRFSTYKSVHVSVWYICCFVWNREWLWFHDYSVVCATFLQILRLNCNRWTSYSVFQMLAEGVPVLLGVAWFIVTWQLASWVFGHAHHSDVVSSLPAESSGIGLMTDWTVHRVPFLFKVLKFPCELLEMMATAISNIPEGGF